ncbi:hypothetical protein ACLB2K_008372 [Fragaria x ananassa]
MQNFSRRFSTLQIAKLSTSPPQPIRPLIPYSEIQNCRKILERRIITVLDVCTTLTQAKQVHAHVITNGLSEYSYVITKLIRTLNKLGVPMGTYPELVFRRVTRPNPFLWAAMIRGCVIEGQVSEAVRFYGLMRREGTGPVSFTFSSFLRAPGAFGM